MKQLKESARWREVQLRRLAEQGFRTYRDYLSSAHWKAFRSRYFASGRRSCVGCETTNDRLSLHHVTYERLGDELESDVVPLCDYCHGEVHGLVDLGVARLSNAHKMHRSWVKRAQDRKIAEQKAADDKKRRKASRRKAAVRTPPKPKPYSGVLIPKCAGPLTPGGRLSRARNDRPVARPGTPVAPLRGRVSALSGIPDESQ